MKLRYITALTCAIATLAMMSLTAGCNTTEGIGQDVEEAGEGIQDAAN